MKQSKLEKNMTRYLKLQVAAYAILAFALVVDTVIGIHLIMGIDSLRYIGGAGIFSLILTTLGFVILHSASKWMGFVYMAGMSSMMVRICKELKIDIKDLE